MAEPAIRTSGMEPEQELLLPAPEDQWISTSSSESVLADGAQGFDPVDDLWSIAPADVLNRNFGQVEWGPALNCRPRCR